MTFKRIKNLIRTIKILIYGVEFMIFLRFFIFIVIVSADIEYDDRKKKNLKKKRHMNRIIYKGDL
jgi:hypothetical protein